MQDTLSEKLNFSVFWNVIAITAVSSIGFVIIFFYNIYLFDRTQVLHERLIQTSQRHLNLEALSAKINLISTDMPKAQVDKIFKDALDGSLNLKQTDVTNELLNIQRDMKALLSEDSLSVEERNSLREQVEKNIRNSLKTIGNLQGSFLGTMEKAQSSLRGAQSTNQTILIILVAGLGLIVVGAGFLIGRSLSSRLTRLATQITQLNDGKLEGQIYDLNRRDEIGDMARSLNVFKHNALKIQRLHSELKTSVAQNQQAAEIKTQFMQRMGQELRTPLNAIIGQSEMIIESVDGGLDIARLRQEIMKIANSGQSLLGMVDTILELDAVDEQASLHLEDFNIRDQIQRMLPSLETTILKYHNKFSVSCPDSNLRMTSDGHKITKILSHLITNAANFTKNGKIVLDMRASTYGDEPGITLTVTDTGCGIRPENIKKIFQPFTQLDTGIGHKSDGLGLGLTIVQKLVTLLGGTIEVESQQNVGSTFRVILPQVLKDHSDISASVQFAS